MRLELWRGARVRKKRLKNARIYSVSFGASFQLLLNNHTSVFFFAVQFEITIPYCRPISIYLSNYLMISYYLYIYLSIHLYIYFSQ